MFKKSNLNGHKININYEGKIKLKFLMKFNVENPNVNKKCLDQKNQY